MSLLHRINRLEQCRRGGHTWIEPAGDQDGIPLEAHVFEHADGRRNALVVSAKIDADTWAAMAQAQQARLLARCQARCTDDAE